MSSIELVLVIFEVVKKWVTSPDSETPQPLVSNTLPSRDDVVQVDFYPFNIPQCRPSFPLISFP